MLVSKKDVLYISLYIRIYIRDALYPERRAHANNRARQLQTQPRPSIQRMPSLLFDRHCNNRAHPAWAANLRAESESRHLVRQPPEPGACASAGGLGEGGRRRSAPSHRHSTTGPYWHSLCRQSLSTHGLYCRTAPRPQSPRP